MKLLTSLIGIWDNPIITRVVVITILFVKLLNWPLFFGLLCDLIVKLCLDRNGDWKGRGCNLCDEVRGSVLAFDSLFFVYLE